MKALLKKRIFLLLIGILLIVISLLSESLFAPGMKDWYVQRKINNAHEHLLQKENIAEELLEKAKKGNPFQEAEWFINRCKEEGVYFYVYSANNLHVSFWTSNSIFPKVAPFQDTTIVESLANGVYIQKNTFYKDFIYITLIPIEYNYPFQNAYLQNTFALLKSGGEDFHLSLKKVQGGESFYSKGGRFLFDLKPQSYHPDFYWIGWIFLLGLLFYCVFIQLTLSNLLSKRNFLPGLGVYILGIIAPVIAWKLFHYPKALFDWQLFSPKLYASSVVLSSLGYLLILSSLVCWTFLLFKRIRLASVPKFLRKTFVFLQVLGVFAMAHCINSVVHSLVSDSSISFDLGNISEISFYTVLSFLAICGFLFSFFIILKIAVWNMFRVFRERRIVLYVISGACIFIVCTSLFLYHITLAGFTFSLICLLFYSFQYKKLHPHRLIIYGVAVATAFITLILSLNNIARNKETQKVLASRLFSERDAVAEYLYGDIINGLRNDNFIQAYFFNPFIGQPVLRQRIEQLYLSGYFSKYDVGVFTYTPMGLPYKGNIEIPQNYFLNFIQNGKATPAREDSALYFLSPYFGLPNYLSVIPIVKEGRFLGTLILDFQQKAFYEESVYPELILSENLQTDKHIKDYSYAIYFNRYLITQKGNYSYSDVLKDKYLTKETYKTIHAEGYEHFIYKISPEQTIIVSDKENGILYYSATFSFILFFFGFIVVLVMSGRSILPNIFKKIGETKGSIKQKLIQFWQNLSFRSKVLLSITASMTLALFLIGFTTVKYISFRYNEDGLLRLHNKTRSIKDRLESQFKSELLANPIGGEELTAMVKNLSKVYQTDINVYDMDGRMLASSLPAIYDKGVIQPRMDPGAFYNFFKLNRSQFIKEENIGTLKYIASYMPLRNYNNQTMAFISLPFFSKERELDEAISSFLVALTNLYLLLFLILLLLSISISNALTAPLNIIRKHLRATSLTTKNEPIIWENNDEIGKLVKEYNRMLYEISESAQRLAQSEREGAWREMAKQVAHEIKNPLTPMKLNIQQLQRAWTDDPERLQDMFGRVTNLLITQIDRLSQIATEFSSFAQMPNEQPQNLDVNEALREAADLFQNSNEVSFVLNLSLEPNFVFIDPGHFARVLNNLIKNATQAMSEDKAGMITLISKRENDKIKIEIRDNGSGIPEELRDKIFVPNFSTKSAGMGLGLAIVKNIIERAGGTIWFDTRLGEGTSFFILLPNSHE